MKTARCLALAWMTLLPAFATASQPQASRPNFLIIMADDLGFSDLGCYGSEIETPNLDRLAADGVRFSQFYNTAKCHSSRISLLTGRYAFQAGNTALTNAVTTAEVLQPAGYFTMMAGKWHLDKQPTDFGFHRFFGHLSGACSYYKGDKTFRLNGEPWQVPDKGFYTTVANVDHALQFLGEARESKKPWYLYLAFNAPHAPLQPLEVDYKKYLGRYNAGWDVMRAARVAKQKALGLFGKELEPSPRPEHIPAWDKLTPAWREWESRRMAAYAALIDRVDQELGRLFDDLKAKGEFDNTLILFVSDNGACPYDRSNQGMHGEPFDPNSSWSDSTGWAWARNTPFRFYKQNQFEGGISTPGIIHWPAGLKPKPGSIVHSPVHLVDVLPTLAELAGAALPRKWPDRDLRPVAGVSFADLLRGESRPSRPPLYFIFSSDRGLRDGDWKLASYKSLPWELYNLAEDRTELHNLASQEPDVLRRMAAQWHDLAENLDHAPANLRRPVAEEREPYANVEWSRYDLPAPPMKEGKRKRAATAAREGNGKASGIRARVGTQLVMEGDELVLTCTGEDAGLAMEHLSPAPGAGPYRLAASIQSKASGKGEIYWTTDPATRLPAGRHAEFTVVHDGEWHDVELPIESDKPLSGLRFDPCSGVGEVRVRNLRLLDAGGHVLLAWPAKP